MPLQFIYVSSRFEEKCKEIISQPLKGDGNGLKQHIKYRFICSKIGGVESWSERTRGLKYPAHKRAGVIGVLYHEHLVWEK
jgi:hypothetical protein